MICPCPSVAKAWVLNYIKDYIKASRERAEKMKEKHIKIWYNPDKLAKTSFTPSELEGWVYDMIIQYIGEDIV